MAKPGRASPGPAASTSASVSALQVPRVSAGLGGRYRLVFGYEGSTMEFFGRYLEVTPHSRLVWTNEEGDHDGTVTTVTFDEGGCRTRVVAHDRYPSKEALDGAIASGSTTGMPEALEQLDELLVTLGASPGRS